MLAIESTKLTRRFPQGGGISGLDLAVPTGSLYGFVGPNGAGKTTTIRLLLGLLRQQSGAVLIDGAPASRTTRAKLGALIESPSVYGHLSGYDNLDVTRRLLDKPRAAIHAVLDRVGLRYAAHQRASDYSLGMRQRLGLALTLLAAPSILILDEPSNGLDPQGIADLRVLLRSFVAEERMTLMVSSHLLSEVEQTATHIGVLYRGELKFQGAITELLAKARPLVYVGCDRPTEAAALLHGAGIDAVQVDSRLRIDSAVPPHVVNRRLVDAGLRVNELISERPSLESMFFGLTQAAEGG